jgi:hypothetical protein
VAWVDKVVWCSWLSRQSNTLKVLSSSLSTITFLLVGGLHSFFFLVGRQWCSLRRLSGSFQEKGGGGGRTGDKGSCPGEMEAFLANSIPLVSYSFLIMLFVFTSRSNSF